MVCLTSHRIKPEGQIEIYLTIKGEIFLSLFSDKFLQ